MLFLNRKFKGGIHPKDNKHLSRGKEIIEIQPEEEVCIPFHQNIGMPSAPNVNKNDKIKEGAILGSPSGFISAFVHSSVSGEITDISEKPHPNGKKVLSAVIKIDKSSDSPQYDEKNEQDIDAIKPNEIVNLVQKAGIVGMGGAAFPTHVKLSPPKGKKIDTVIINAAECEPYLTADETLIINKCKQILKGALLLKKAVGAKRIVIGIEDNKPEAIAELKKNLIDFPEIELAVLPTRYPQGGEKQLIKAILDKEVPSGGLPMDVNTLVQNTATAYAVYEAVYMEKPLTERIVTISGEGIKKPGNYKIKIGTKIIDALKQAGFEDDENKFIIMGGPMMGLPILDLEAPVIKSTSGLLVFNKLKIKKEYPCIRCARCISHCPIGLSPTEIASAYLTNNIDKLKALHAMDCIECGCCSYICPAGIPLVQYIKLSKGALRKNARK